MNQVQSEIVRETFLAAYASYWDPMLSSIWDQLEMLVNDLDYTAHASEDYDCEIEVLCERIRNLISG